MQQRIQVVVPLGPTERSLMFRGSRRANWVMNAHVVIAGQVKDKVASHPIPSRPASLVWYMAASAHVITSVRLA